MSVPAKLHEPNLARRHRIGQAFEWLCCGSTWFGIVVLGVLLLSVGWKAVTWPTEKAKPENSPATAEVRQTSAPLSQKFLTSYDSRKPREAGILAALWGSLWLIVLVALFSVPIGVGSAVYLEEYSNEGRLKRLIQVNLSNLAGVPSIVYGILGMTAFVKMFGLFHKEEGKSLVINLLFTTVDVPLPFDRTLISGALTLTLLVLPTVIVASQEALRAVPSSIRTASYALGATQWQTIRHQVVPAALPGIMTGVILALSRAMGEAAPLMLIGALTYVAYTPGEITNISDIFKNPQGLLDAPFDKFTALPLQIYNWINHPRAEYAHLAAAGIVVLLSILLLMNTAAILIRHRFQKQTRW
ncbi:MAG: phosphate transport system permease protein [Planctomycetota bacterium]|nr:MAG: phosphate transport system permease protein [Planctomycetota bacterium]